MQFIEVSPKHHNELSLSESSSINLRNRAITISGSKFSKYSFENFLKGNCDYPPIFENLYNSFNYSQELAYNDFTTVQTESVINSKENAPNSTNSIGSINETSSLEANNATKSVDLHHNTQSSHTTSNATNDAKSADLKSDNNIEIHEPKPRSENHTIKRLQSSILHNIQAENGPMKIDNISHYDKCNGNETCMKDLKIIEHLRAVDSILEWIFDHANLLAVINI